MRQMKLLNLSQFLALDSIYSFTAVYNPSQWCNTTTICSGVPRLCQNSIRLISVLDSINFNQCDRNVYIQHSIWTFVIYVIKACSQQKYKLIVFRDATIPFFPIRSDPENSEYRPIPIRSSFFFFLLFFFFINVKFLYFCFTLFCVKHNLLDNFILMKNNMKIYIGAVYTWSLVMRFVYKSDRWSGPHSRWTGHV